MKAKLPQNPMALVPKPIPPDWQLQIPGEHNRENAAFAAAALGVLGLSEETIKNGLESFEGVEGRLQFVREISGVKIYNDNNATTPEATIAALKALSKYGHPVSIFLIMGGSDKGLDTHELISTIQSTCKAVYLLAGTGTDRIAAELKAMQFQSIEAALKEALGAAESGDIVLFSPAFASFGMFKNEYDRNDQFLKLVAAL
jgi:UDP-N-acetylmuramoylalanine--D-glutamate ligase